MKHLLNIKTAIGALVLLVMGAAGWYLFIRNPYASAETLTLHPAAFAEQVAVSGTVGAAQDVALGFPQGGKVVAINAAAGDSVKKGDALAEISNTDLKAAVAQKQAALDAQEAQLSLLEAGTRPEELAVIQAQVASDRAALSQAAQAVVNAIEASYTAADDSVHNKTDVLFDNPQSDNPSLTVSSSDSQAAATLLSERVALNALFVSWKPAVAALSSQDAVSAPADTARGNLAQVAQFLADANALLNKAAPSASVSQATIDTYAASVAAARAAVNTAAAALTTAVTAGQAAQDQLTKDEKTLSLELAGSTAQDIDAQKAQVAAAQADLANAQAQLSKTLVEAPFDGTITRMDAKVGETVSTNSSEISIISKGAFQINAYIPEIYIASVKAGDQASTTLEAYGASVAFPAQVVSVDPSATPVGGVPAYKTTLQLLTDDARIKSGMTANVTITTKLIPNAISVPLGAVATDAAGQYVEILKGRSALRLPVVLGARSALGSAEILSGAQDGDTILLNPTP